MIENLTQLLQSDARVVSYVADRIYMTIAPQGTIAPFIVWQPISNVPYNSLSCRPDADQQRLQADVYADSPVTARELTAAVQDCIQRDHSIIAGPLPSFEEQTQLHRYSMDCTVFYQRDVSGALYLIFRNGEQGGLYTPNSDRWQDPAQTTPADGAGETINTWGAYEGPDDATAPGPASEPTLVQ